jgi:glutathione synthase/RimK-type ligase-like ATP-grasp enzyme
MNALLVVNHPRDWPIQVPGMTVVSARAYLTDPSYSEGLANIRVINLCRTDRYQGRGYYVSLLAEARGHRPMPEAQAIGDLQMKQIGPLTKPGFREQMQRILASVEEDRLVLRAYFGRDPQGRFDPLSAQLCALLHAPLACASFVREDGEWRVDSAHLLAASDIAIEHRAFAASAAAAFIGAGRAAARDLTRDRPAVAILYNDDEPNPPSNPGALEKFEAAAESLGMRTEFLRRDDLKRVVEFDALFIRDTTSIGHYTYQFARRAAASGLVVVDDPDSIMKCTNKVYLHELLSRHRVRTPRTLMVHRDNVESIVPTLGLPCVLKQPDGAFSLGVSKVESVEALRHCVAKLLAESDLIVAQEWLPTRFDWRVGVYDRRPLYVCKYFMAPGHWQVIKREAGRNLEGRTQALAIGEAPESVIRTAVRAANLVGDGFYGVDLKETSDNNCVVMEINDNPNVDAGNEDAVLGSALYREIMGVFSRRTGERRIALRT